MHICRILISKKLCGKIIGSNINFFIDSEKYFYSNAANILTSNTASLETLVAFLNSRLFEWYFKKIIFIEVEGGGIQMFNTVMERIPIPVVDNEKQIYFTDLVTKISTNNDININRIINNLVYQIMSLTKDEIAFIENLQT